MSKIIFVGFEIEGLGGISTYSRYQISALREKFTNVYAISLQKTRPVFPGIVDEHIGYKNKIDIFKVFRRLYSLVDKDDLIVFNHVNLSIVGTLLKVMKNIKYIIFGYNIDLLRKFNIFNTYGLASSDRLIIDCKFTIDNLSKFHKKIPKIELLYDPVDVGFFKTIDKKFALEQVCNTFGLDRKILSNSFIITTVAVMRKNEMYKGHYEILDAISKITKNNNIFYFIVGSGDGMDLVKEKVMKLNLKDRVKLFGFVENDLIPSFYNASDVVALISTNSEGKGEGVPLGLIEASSCAVPILAGNEDGSFEAISDKYSNGFRVSPKNIDGIAQKIQFYMDDPSVRKEHGENGRKFVIEEFEYSKFRDKQAVIIEDVLND